MRRSNRLACLAFLAATAIFGGGGTARGAIITQYAFTGATLNRSATTVDGNVTAGNITDSPTVNGNATSVLIRTNGVGYPSEVLSAARANFNESSVRANVFFTFTVSPNAGMELDLSSLTFNVAQGGGTASTLRSPLKRRQLRDEPYQHRAHPDRSSHLHARVGYPIRGAVSESDGPGDVPGALLYAGRLAERRLR